jgi:hypothetical protein
MTTESARISSTWGPSKRFTLGPGILSCTDKDGTAVLNVQHDRMYSVIGVGSLILAKLATSESGLTFGAIVDKITMEVEKVPRQQAERHVARLLGVFQQKGLVQPDTPEAQRHMLPMHRWAIFRFIFFTRGFVSLLIRLRAYTLAAFLGLFVINIILKVIGFGALYQLVKSWLVSSLNNDSHEAVQWVSAAVDRATTWYPKQAQCLQRSAVAVCLLRTCGLPAQMVIGITKVPFKSHAWAEIFGEVVNDKPKVSTRYKILDRW